MIKFFRRLWRDKRGNALLLAGAAMPILVGAAGLANDTIQWTLWKRQLQRAADSAAIAGVYEREASSGSQSGVSAVVCHDVSLNLHTWMKLKATTPCTEPTGSYTSLTFPADTAAMRNQVAVTLAIQQRLAFSSLFLSTAPTITASATAASVSAGGTACMQALEPSASVTGIFNNGNATVNAPTCILYSNSPSTNSASAGGSSSITARAVAGVGGISQSNNWHVQQYIPYSPPLPDPFADVDVDPTDMHCTTAAADKNTNWTAMIAAGTNCFSSMGTQPNDTINIPANFGPIYINGGNVDLKGTINCTGCTIVLTNSDTSPTATIGTFNSNSQASNNIVAPTTGNYGGIAIYQDRRATSGNSNTVNGGSGNVIQGAVYFPNGLLRINGTGSLVSLCAMWVAKDISLIGTSSITISSPDDAACSGTGMPSASSVRMVRLVA